MMRARLMGFDTMQTVLLYFYLKNNSSDVNQAKKCENKVLKCSPSCFEEDDKGLLESH